MIRSVVDTAHTDAGNEKDRSPMFVHNCWYVAGWSDDFADGALVCRTVLDEPIVLYRKGDSGIVALEDRCCH